MGIFSRMSDIINANIIHLLDRAEDPEKMVRMMIQEMEDTLVEVKSNAARMIADKKTKERHGAQLKQAQEEWLAKAELAISKNREDLAKGAIEEKNKKAEQVEIVTAEMARIDAALVTFKGDIEKLEAKLRDAKTRQQSIVARKQSATSRVQIQRQLGTAESSKAMQRFSEFERSIDRLEGEVEVRDLSSTGNPLEQEFDKLERDGAVEDELAELKKKLGKKNRG